MNGARFDAWRCARRGEQVQRAALGPDMQLVTTVAGRLRLLDTGGRGPVIVMVPDGPCVIEHFLPLIALLRDDFRVLCFDLPGFGFSFPAPAYRFGMDETADCVIEVLDALHVPRAVLAFSCVNGFFALNAARRFRERIAAVVLAQTPDLDSMRAWADRMIPAPLTWPLVGQLLMATQARRFAGDWFDLALPRESAYRDPFAELSVDAVRRGGCFCLASLVQGVRRDAGAEPRGAQCPVTMVHGDQDFSHKYTDFRHLLTDVPHARVETRGGCGHFPDLEQPERHAGLLRSVIAAAA